MPSTPLTAVPFGRRNTKPAAAPVSLRCIHEVTHAGKDAINSLRPLSLRTLKSECFTETRRAAVTTVDSETRDQASRVAHFPVNDGCANAMPTTLRPLRPIRRSIFSKYNGHVSLHLFARVSTRTLSLMEDRHKRLALCPPRRTNRAVTPCGGLDMIVVAKSPRVHLRSPGLRSREGRMDTYGLRETTTCPSLVSIVTLSR